MNYLRSEKEMMKIIMQKAHEDDRIRAVAMDGSRANSNAIIDNYSDFDIVYFVKDVREFTKDKTWIEYFGEILIVQYPEDWYASPYNYDSHDNFAYLIQFEDGNRIDLTIVDIRNISKEVENKEPRIVLLNKDNFKELKPVDGEEAYYIKPPTKMEFYNTCNEFRWISIYISKGLCREEFYYARYCYEVIAMKMFMKMINWKIGIDFKFNVTTGSHNKYLKHFLSTDEMQRLQNLFPSGEYEDMWNKLLKMYNYFAELAILVSSHFNYVYDEEETVRVKAFIEKRKAER